MRARAALLLLLCPAVVRAQLTCGDATVEARSLHYCTGGTRTPTVVFESAVGAGAAQWDSVAARVASFARVVSYDRAGYGSSARAPGGRSPADIAADLRLLLDRLGERDPVVLVAHTDGAWFARTFAHVYPARVRALVLLDPPHEEFETRAAAILSPAERVARDSARAAAVAGLPEAGRREHDGIIAAAAADLPDVPLVILTGGRHGWIPAARAAELEAIWQELETALAARVSSGRTVLLADGGSDLAATRPAAAADAIREIITRSEPAKTGLSLGEILAIVGIVVSLVTWYLAWRQGRHGATYNVMQIEKARAEKAREEARAAIPHQVRLGDLIAGDTPRDGRALALVRAVNARAVSVFRSRLQGGPADPVASLLWDRTWPERDWNAQRAWVEPDPTGEGSLAGEVLDMLRNPRAGQVWVLGLAGAGKSTFMNRLFFEALGATRATSDASPGASAPAPMFIQPRNVDVGQIAVLRHTGNAFPAFIDGWLQNRSIAVAEDDRPALVRDFEQALRDGRIALFVDGFDELVDLGLLSFFQGLLDRTACWVCAERSDRRVSRSGATVALPGTWTLDQIEGHLAARWPEKPDWAARVHALLRKDTDGDHLVRVPRYLDLFLGLLESRSELPDESDLQALLAGGPELASAIVTAALARLPRSEDVTEHELNARLFQVAAARVEQADFVLPRARKDAAWTRILQMTEFVSTVVTPDGDHVRITHPAMVDYFLAGEIASELRSGAARITQGDRHWSRGLLAGVSAWLRRAGDPTVLAEIWHRIRAHDAATPATNLLELAVQLDLDARQHPRDRRPEQDRRREVRIADKDLSGRNLAGAELRLVTFERCQFRGADLTEADLQHATFHDGDFAGANLTGATAQGAEFARCRFLDPEDPDRLPVVTGLQVEAAEFHEGTDAASDVDAAWLTGRGAVRTRTRYGDEFGRVFFRRQAAFLGQVADSLERGAYRERIESALARCAADRPITVVDLMAGGGNEWLAGLVTTRDGTPSRFPGLRVLGIDRDEPQLRELRRQFPEVFKWHRLEIGPGPLDLRAIAGEAFEGPGRRLAVDLVVAKKAIHELRRPHQPRLLRHCFEGLRDGGELVLFADSPGPEDPGSEGIVEADFAALDGEVRALLDDPDTGLATIRERVVAGLRLGGSPADQARFCNLWVMLKDWANDNRHEVRNRWFSSAAELRAWARDAGFEESAPMAAARYRIAVARFNERGIQRVIHHLERNGAAAIRNDASMLTDWLSATGDERQSLLLEFTAHHLAPGSALAQALGLKPVRVDWGLIHESLRGLPAANRETLSFEFPVHVLSFRKPATPS